MKIRELFKKLTISILGICMVLVPGSAMAQKTFKVGLCMTFSGPAGAWGVTFGNSCRLVADSINAKGGLDIGGEKYKIIFVEGDTKFTPEGSATVAQRLIDREKVNMIVGAIVSHTTLGMQELTEPAKVISLTTAMSDKVISATEGKKYSYRAYISISEVLSGMFQWMAKHHPDKKRIAMVDEDYESAWIAQKMVKKYAPSLGYEVVYDDFFPLGTKDLFPWLTKAMLKKPDVLLNVGSSNPSYALAIKQAAQLNFKGLKIECIPMALNLMSQIGGAANMEGLHDIEYLSSGPQVSVATKDFMARYAKAHGSWDPNALLLPPAFEAILRAFEVANSLDPDKVKAVLESGRSWQTVSGVTGRFGSKSRYGRNAQWLAPQYIHQVENGQVAPVKDGKISIDQMLKGWSQ